MISILGSEKSHDYLTVTVTWLQFLFIDVFRWGPKLSRQAILNQVNFKKITEYHNIYFFFLLLPSINVLISAICSEECNNATFSACNLHLKTSFFQVQCLNLDMEINAVLIIRQLTTTTSFIFFYVCYFLFLLLSQKLSIVSFYLQCDFNGMLTRVRLF